LALFHKLNSSTAGRCCEVALLAPCLGDKSMLSQALGVKWGEQQEFHSLEFRMCAQFC
jgi:hypothetical protein